MKKDEEELVVGGYRFYTEKDAQLARAERKKIEYLEERIDYSAPDTIRYIYEKSIHERIFKTPVGLEYQKKLRDFLLAQPEVKPESIMEIPLYMTYDGELRSHTEPARARVTPAKQKDTDKNRFIISAILNVLLILAIIAMFTISFKSEQPNIFNYEKALVDKYASWEQELTEREQMIREKEKELQIRE